MKYLEGFRNQKAAKVLNEEIRNLAAALAHDRLKVRIMEVCGTHTMAIARYGIRSLMPENVELISGPGCPVCVTDTGYIDTALELAGSGIIIATFGDLLRVPGSDSSLAKARSEGAEVEICYSPLEAVDLAASSPDKEVVFLGVGFETTICPVLGMIEKSIKEGVDNLSALTAFKVVPPALDVLASSDEIKIDAFLCPAHVSAIIGSRAYEPVVSKYKLPGVIAGFEPLDILYGLRGILEQIVEGAARVDNQYSRVVKPEGNVKALALMEKMLEPINAIWRGLGQFSGSGLALRSDYQSFDAEKKYGLEIKAGKPQPGCRCGDVLKGMIKPPECELFGRRCNPQEPVGPCMVSSEGSCSAWFKYGGAKSL